MHLARFFLCVVYSTWVGAALTGIAIGIFFAWQLAALLVVVLAYFHRPTFKGTGWNFGSGRWARKEELISLMYGSGIPLGVVGRISIRTAGGILRRTRKHPEAGVRAFLAALDRKSVHVHGAGTHGCVFAGAGRGKTTAIVLPFMYLTPDSVICVDIKGEIAAQTARFRKKRFGHRIVILAPYGVEGFKSDTFNVIDMIHRDSPHALDDCRAVAEALVVRTGEEKEPVWNVGAEMFIAGIVALVASFPESDPNRNLQTVAAVLANPTTLAGAIKKMQESTAWGGLLARMGDQLANFQGKELGSTLTTIARHLRFLMTPAMVESTSKSSFDIRNLDNVTVYLCIPPERISSQSGIVRLWVTSFLRAITQSGLKQKKIRFMLDEAAALGRLEQIENAIAQLRGYGLSMTFVYQSMGQLKKCFTDGQDQTFLSNMDTQVFFGVNDVTTAQHVSSQLGEMTLQNWSANGSTTRTRSFDHRGLESSSSTSSDGYSVQEASRHLLQPAEVMRLDEREAVCFVSGYRPFLTHLVRSYEPEFKKRLRNGPLARAWIIARCGLLAAISVGVFTFALYCMFELEARQTQSSHQSQSRQLKTHP